MAALDSALAEALVGISQEQAASLKSAVADAMGEIIEKIISPAIRVYPELALDAPAWAEVAQARARTRCKLDR